MVSWGRVRIEDVTNLAGVEGLSPELSGLVWGKVQ